MSSSVDTSYNLYDKITSIDWNGQHFILTARNEITGNTFAYAYSADGITWTKTQFYNNITTPNKNPYTIKCLGDKFIAIGDLVASSTDNSDNCLINIVDGEFPVALPTNLTNTIMYDIEQNLEQPHRIVFPKTTVLSLGNNIAYSFNQGQSWSIAANSVFSTSANDVVWNGRIWVACGTGTANTIATSLDGIHWLGRGNSVFSTECNGIDWSSKDNKYVAVGSGTNIVATSMDGIYWRGTNTTLFSVGRDVKWNGSIWVAVGNSPSVGNTIAYSYDAISWQYAATSFQTSGLRVHYDESDSMWIAYGSDPSYNIATSADGINWTFSYSAGATEVAFNMPRGLFADSSLNLYPGIPYPLYNTTVSNVKRYVHNHSDRGCAYIQPISIACGSGSCVLAYSVDGIQWTAINTSLFTQCNKSIWNGSRWVVVGEGAYWVATSSDGLNWTGQDSTKMTKCYDIAWNGSYFVAVGIKDNAAALATSPDGITWTTVSISSIFSTNIHAIEWTGTVWLAYGSGTNTTAISSSLDASGWTATPVKNLCNIDSLDILLSNITSTTASSEQGFAANAFYNSTTTKWYSSSSNYDISGNYIGASVTQGVSGEWVQVQLTSSSICANYYLVFSVTDGSAIPQSWTLFGSGDGNNWSSIDTFTYGTSTLPSSDKYPYVCLPLDIQSGSIAAYSYYRIVFTKSFGADRVSVAKFALFNSGASQLNIRIRPIVLKDLILHPTRILSIDGTVPTICRITDLSCNLIRNGLIHNGLHANNIIYGLTSPPSTSVFDGVHHVVVSNTGEVSYLSNAASNTNLKFDSSINGVEIPDVSGSVFASCYNRKFILAGSSYGGLNESSPPAFYPNNLSSLLTVINGLASNSGHGFVVSPNTLCLGEEERLSVVTPKFYDEALSSGTSLSFNVYKSSNTTNTM